MDSDGDVQRILAEAVEQAKREVEKVKEEAGGGEGGGEGEDAAAAEAPSAEPRRRFRFEDPLLSITEEQRKAAAPDSFLAKVGCASRPLRAR